MYACVGVRVCVSPNSLFRRRALPWMVGGKQGSWGWGGGT